MKANRRVMPVTTLCAVCLIGSSLLAPISTAQASPEQPVFTLESWQAGELNITGGDPAIQPNMKRSEDVTVHAASTSTPNVVRDGTATSARVDSFGSIQKRTGGPIAVVDTLGIKIGFMTASTAKFVDLSWQQARAGMVYTIRRDDKIITQTTRNSFRDKSVEPGHDYYYVVSSDPVQDPPKNQAPGVPTVFGMPVYTPASDSSADRRALLGKVNWASSANLKTAGADVSATQSAVAAAAPGEDGRVSLRSFIPSQYFEPPVATLSSLGCGGYKSFAGDNRSFGPWKTGVRIAEDVRIYWASRGVYRATTTGETKALNPTTHAVIATKTATNNDGAVYWNMTSSSVTTKSWINAGNPFCSVGYIYAEVTANVNSNGGASISGGWLKKMPYIELYYHYWTGTGYVAKTLGQKSNNLGLCLIDYTPGCTEGW